MMEVSALVSSPLRQRACEQNYRSKKLCRSMVYCKNRRFPMCLGIPGKILDIVDEDNSIAKVDVSGVKRNVNVALVRPEGIAPGDWVLIHVGFAMSKIDEDEARETMKALALMGEVYTDELHMLQQSQIE